MSDQPRDGESVHEFNHRLMTERRRAWQDAPTFLDEHIARRLYWTTLSAHFTVDHQGRLPVWVTWRTVEAAHADRHTATAGPASW